MLGAQLKTLAPSLTRYKVVPIDANHPQYGTGLAMSRNVHKDPANPSEDSWLTAAFEFVAEFSNAKAKRLHKQSRHSMISGVICGSPTSTNFGFEF